MTTTQIQTWDVREWRDQRDAQLHVLMPKIGEVIAGSRPGRLDLEGIAALNIDPRVIDRGRHNLSWCQYSTGEWSVAATTAFSAFYMRPYNEHLVPMEMQWVYSSTEGLRHPTSYLESGWRGRCRVDGIDGPYDRENSGGEPSPIGGGWIYSRDLGLVMPGGHDTSRWIPGEELSDYRQAPWDWD